MAQLYNVDSPISREQRNNLNATFEDIQRRFSAVQIQIGILAGGEDLEQVLQSIQNALDTANQASTDANSAITQLNDDLTRLENAIMDSSVVTGEARQAILDLETELTNLEGLISDLGNAESYDNTKTYRKNNVVEYNGSSYMALQETTGNLPPTLPIKNNTYWQLLAQRGVDGLGSVVTVSNKSPDINGNVELTNTDVNAPSLETFNETIDELREDSIEDVLIGAKYYRIPSQFKNGVWQGVTILNGLIYTASDRNENFDFNNSINVYTLDGKLINRKVTVYDVPDPQGRFLSFGDINAIDGRLYATFYNTNDGGNPSVSRVVVFDPDTLDVLEEHAIGGNTAESVTFNNGSYWVVYHDIDVVREFDTNFNQINEYPLNISYMPHGGPQGSLWEGNRFYVNLHGHNDTENGTPFVQVREYEFDGTTFNFISDFRPPTNGCGQGLSKYKNYYIWNDRVDNSIVISKSLRPSNIYPSTDIYSPRQTNTLPLQNGFGPLSPDRTPKVTLLNGVVHFTGAVTVPPGYQADGNPQVFPFMVPVQYVDSTSKNFVAITNVGPVRIALANRLDANNARKIVIGSADIPLSNLQWVSFDGISYPLIDPVF